MNTLWDGLCSEAKATNASCTILSRHANALHVTLRSSYCNPIHMQFQAWSLQPCSYRIGMPTSVQEVGSNQKARLGCSLAYLDQHLGGSAVRSICKETFFTVTLISGVLLITLRIEFYNTVDTDTTTNIFLISFLE